MKRFVFLLILACVAGQANAQIKISEMQTYAGNPSGSWVPIVINNASRKIDAKYFGYTAPDSFRVSNDTLFFKNKTSGIAGFVKLPSGTVMAYPHQPGQYFNGYGVFGNLHDSILAAIGYTPYNAANPNGYVTSNSTATFTNKSGNISQWTNNAGYITGISGSDVTTALGYTPYNATNPNGYVTGVSTTTFTNKSGNISQWTNNAGYITGISSSDVTTALGFTPYNATNPNGYVTGSSTTTFTNKSGNISQWTNNAGYITGINSSDVTTALGFTPYNATNPNGYVTASSTNTFTNKSGNISQWTNDAGYLGASSHIDYTKVDGLSTVAHSGSYNDLLDKPTGGGGGSALTAAYYMRYVNGHLGLSNRGYVSVGDRAHWWGDSYTYGALSQNYLSTGNYKFVDIISSRYGLTSTNHGYPGFKTTDIVYSYFATTPSTIDITNNPDVWFYCGGANDMFRTDNANRVEQDKGTLRTMIANHYLATVASASTVTKSGSWYVKNAVSNYGDKSSIQLGGKVQWTNSTSATMTYSFTGDNLVIGTFGVDENAIKGGIFTVTVDGTLRATFDNRNKATGLHDVLFNDNTDSLSPNVVCIKDLGAGSHSAVIAVTTLSSGGKVYIDYVGTLMAPTECRATFVSLLPNIDFASGVTTLTTTAAQYRELDTAYFSVIDEFKNFPVYPVYTNDFLDSANGIDHTDHLHPNTLGHAQWANAISAAIKIDQGKKMNLQNVTKEGYTTTTPILINMTKPTVVNAYGTAKLGVGLNLINYDGSASQGYKGDSVVFAIGGTLASGQPNQARLVYRQGKRSDEVGVSNGDGMLIMYDSSGNVSYEFSDYRFQARGTATFGNGSLIMNPAEIQVKGIFGETSYTTISSYENYSGINGVQWYKGGLLANISHTGGNWTFQNWHDANIDFKDNSNNILLGTRSGYTYAKALAVNGGLDASAVVDIQSTTKGLLYPRMTTAQRTAISSPAEGLTVWDLDLHKPYSFDGTSWHAAW